jgi:glycosyltransferase involved in cell wall biosynthesis
VRVAQVSCVRDVRRRPGAELLQAWPTLVDVACAAASAGMDVHVVQAAWRDETLERGGVPVHLVADRSPRLPIRLIRAVRALRPEVIHFQGWEFPLQARVLSAMGIPLLVQDHGSRLPRPARRPLLRWGYGRIAGAAFTAREQAEPFRAAGVLRPATPVFEVLESSSAFTPGDAEAARAATGIHGDPCVLWVGRLMADKEPLTALEGFARAAERLPDARLWMAYGDAPLEAEVRARVAADPRLRERVHLLGRVPHATVQALCRAADLFVSASRREGSGYAVLEAMACGAVPVAADIPALRRILAGCAAGALFPVGDAGALADALVAQAGRNREAERRRILDRFDHNLSFPAVGQELRTAYQGVAG